MTLVLVRHGQTEWNLQHRTQGHGNSPLTAKGLFQAERAGRALAGCAIDSIYCSDAGRAVQTADVIRDVNRHFTAAVRDPRLRELHFGDWEGLRHDEIVERFPELYAVYRDDPAAFRAPNGESFAEQQERFLRFAQDLPLETKRTILVVSHAGLIRIALLTMTGRSVAQMRSIPSVPEASISLAESMNGAWTVRQSCDTRHLQDPGGIP
jgi:probable phosphoglycerate mutase